MLDHAISFEKMKFGLLRNLSNVLGITFDEFINTHPDLSPVLSKNGAVKSYTVSFRTAPSVEVQNKIKKISSDGKIHLDYYILNDLMPNAAIGNVSSGKLFHSEKITVNIVL